MPNQTKFESGIKRTPPEDKTLWCYNSFVAVICTIMVMFFVIVSRWPVEESLSDDFGLLLEFAVTTCFITNLVFSLPYVLVGLFIILKLSGPSVDYSGTTNAALVTSLVTPWATATVLVILYVGILVVFAVIGTIIVLGIMFAALNS